MGSLLFDKEGFAKLPTKHHGDITLSKWKWDEICREPERTWYRFNEEKIATTLIVPDEVKHNSKYAGQIIYYKAFDSYKIFENVEVPAQQQFRYFCIVIDPEREKVCTVMPRDKPKKGQEFNEIFNKG